jgi:hypothetical protein
MYSFWLGGKDYLAPDRHVAAAVLAIGPPAEASQMPG